MEWHPDIEPEIHWGWTRFTAAAALLSAFWGVYRIWDVIIGVDGPLDMVLRTLTVLAVIIAIIMSLILRHTNSRMTKVTFIDQENEIKRRVEDLLKEAERSIHLFGGMELLAQLVPGALLEDKARELRARALVDKPELANADCEVQEHGVHLCHFHGAPRGTQGIHYIVFDSKDIVVLCPSREKRNEHHQDQAASTEKANLAAILLLNCPQAARGMVNSMETITAFSREDPASFAARVPPGPKAARRARGIPVAYPGMLIRVIPIVLVAGVAFIAFLLGETRETVVSILLGVPAAVWFAHCFSPSGRKKILPPTRLCILLIMDAGILLGWWRGWQFFIPIVYGLSAVLWAYYCYRQIRECNNLMRRVEVLDDEGKLAARLFDRLAAAPSPLYYWGGIGLIGDFHAWKRLLRQRMRHDLYRVKRVVNWPECYAARTQFKTFNAPGEEEGAEDIDRKLSEWWQTQEEYAGRDRNANEFCQCTSAPVWKYGIHCIVFGEKDIAIAYTTSEMFSNAILIRECEKAAHTLIRCIESACLQPISHEELEHIRSHWPQKAEEPRETNQEPCEAK